MAFDVGSRVVKTAMGREKQIGIQVARAIAALSIVYFHSWVAITRFPRDTAYPIPGLTSYGWFAVDLFFAISGYVICLVASRETFSVPSFLIKRVFRLYPLWLVMLTAFTVSAWLWRGLLPGESFGFFVYSATLLPTMGYPLYDIGWTLQHEIAFYLAAAVLVPLFGIRGLAIFLLASTVVYRTFDLPWYAAYLASRYAEFLAGVVAFTAKDRLERFGFSIPAAIGVALIIVFGEIDLESVPIGLFFLIVAFANMETGEHAWWRKSAVALGNASYSIYLIHPMIFLFASSAVSKLPVLPLWIEEPIRFSCIGLAVSCALLSWKYFEQPTIRIGSRIAASFSSSAPDAINVTA